MGQIIIEKLLNYFGYYKKDEYSLYMLNELVEADEYEINEMESKNDTGSLLSFIKGRKVGYAEALEMIQEHYIKSN